ncbi:L-lactate dehydrogenase [Murimonas intestini]|uniref:L-lactate dehydrogenase n=1 Tax=Murimonas intestini TaxID=1337051 RepID=A0AB73T9B9_9FIRM|nr:L-lactate dehydrogenase [Murimonas intestini]MCR1839343.1 L-lactate dehydrogenase [Murimonas intestini]MCR1864638.1 L-lactate dehydrogenase [Murimonas intestini]MCR1882248.1 L-lactate dehydrogenase [Murimonas intestini]
MKKSHKDKIVVVGAGNVGEAIAYTLMVRVQANDIVLVDVNEDRAKGAALDIAHGTSFFKQVWVRQGGYEECADAQMIIITAGIARKPGQTRLDLAKTNVSIVKSITENIMKYAKNPLILVVSNPADITTMAVQQVSGLPAERVIGSGTSLDTARFRYILSEKLHVNIEDINAYILGEHGDSQVPIYSSANVGGFPLEEYAGQVGAQLDKKAIAERTKNGGAEVIKLKGATFYGIAMAVSNIVETIMKDDNALLPVAHVLDESFGEWAGVAISLPCRLGWEGIVQTHRIPMDENEKKLMDHSAELLKEFAKQALA